ncbi:TetR/AcrR family transcriptional regulator [Pontibacter litorisediminis]|uniref:TetR/AcrR family transcriptional regulator n=1 Tax=Pontibacter litorisediminis TaxID=1846260 RepID=UPI0023EC4ECA|nr:TetR/AcrR family transcriptional regulator [Pontibacter litorisediminis]
MATSIQINLKHQSYLREPEATELGRKIVSESIKMIDELGFEDFTFKKLAAEIGSTEASIYRYFENKHKLLVYLVSWYWAWLHYLVMFQTQNIPNPRERLSRALEVISKAGEADDPTVVHIDERVLHRVVVAESSKVYYTKAVDTENKAGYFLEMKHFCHYLALMVLEINPAYPYPHALMSTLLEAAHQQLFFAQHLPSLTDVKAEQYTETVGFLKQMVFAAVDQHHQHLNTTS